jgi:hypothetical protein
MSLRHFHRASAPCPASSGLAGTRPLPSPAHLQEWAQQYGLTAFTDGTFQSALDLVHARLNVLKQRGAPHNAQNARLMEGLAALGCEPQAYPTNCDAEACSGYCSLGCRCACVLGVLGGGGKLVRGG